MSRLRIVHRTGFRYEEPATASYNEARMLPHSGGEQFVLQAGPRHPARRDAALLPRLLGHARVDVRGAHAARELSVTATSLVEVRPAPVPGTRARAGTSSRAASHVDASASSRRPRTSASDRAARRGRRARRRDRRRGGDPSARRPSRSAAPSARRWSTCAASPGVHSTAAEAWGERKGVCQDIAHVALGALRSVGIPARYVSGYLHPDAGAADRRDRDRRVARLGRVVRGGVARLRPDEPRRGRRAPRARRPRPRLQRRAAAARRVRRAERLGAVRQRSRSPARARELRPATPRRQLQRLPQWPHAHVHRRPRGPHPLRVVAGARADGGGAARARDRRAHRPLRRAHRGAERRRATRCGPTTIADTARPASTSTAATSTARPARTRAACARRSPRVERFGEVIRETEGDDVPLVHPRALVGLVHDAARRQPASRSVRRGGAHRHGVAAARVHEHRGPQQALRAPRRHARSSGSAATRPSPRRGWPTRYTTDRTLQQLFGWPQSFSLITRPSKRIPPELPLLILIGSDDPVAGERERTGPAEGLRAPLRISSTRRSSSTRAPGTRSSTRRTARRCAPTSSAGSTSGSPSTDGDPRGS